MTNYRTEQENFWVGDFGDQYVDRNQGNHIIAANTALFGKILSRTRGIKSVLELGANIGLNLYALRQLLPQAEMSAVEINSKAAECLEKNLRIPVFNQSLLDFSPDQQWDFVLIKTVLIHIAPEALPVVYDLLYKASFRYICLVEYYNPTPVETQYRGHSGKLFKRDFAGEMMDRFPDLKLVDYGFAYRRDPAYPMDDFTWFLLEKADAA